MVKNKQFCACFFIFFSLLFPIKVISNPNDFSSISADSEVIDLKTLRLFPFLDFTLSCDGSAEFSRGRSKDTAVELTSLIGGLPAGIADGAFIFLDETQNWGQGFKVLRELFSEQSKIQQVELFENEFFGKVLTLNKSIQITEADEFTYNEMIAHVPLMEHSCPENILIIGGGGGGSIKEVLKHSTVKHVDFVEIDSSVVQACQEYFPELSRNSFKDDRVQVIIQDGMKFLKESPSQHYDIIICDPSEPVGISKQLYKLEFYTECQRCLNPSGILCTLIGMPFYHSKDTVHLYHPITFEKLSSTIFPQVNCFALPVPSFSGGLVFMGLALKNPHDLSSLEDLEQRIKRVEGNLKCYDPAYHISCFVLPAPY